MTRILAIVLVVYLLTKSTPRDFFEHLAYIVALGCSLVYAVTPNAYEVRP